MGKTDGPAPTNGEEVSTCDNCGALVTPQATRCHRCGRHVRALSIDQRIFDLLVPERFSDTPATALLSMLIVAWYVIVAVATSGDAVVVVSGYSARLFGALDSSWVVYGEYWRFLTSVFMHHDLLHLGFNLYALTVLGAMFERYFGPRRLVVVFVLLGALSMAGSFGWFLFNPFETRLSHQTLGASGAISVVMGSLLITTWRKGLNAREDFRRILIWTALIILIGFGFSGGRLDNAAHVGGLILGALAAPLLKSDEKSTEITRGGRVGWSVAMYVSLVAVIASLGMVISTLVGVPTHLERDGYPRSIFMIQVQEGAAWDFSDQNRLYARCRTHVLEGDDVDQDLMSTCRQNALANSHDTVTWLLLEESCRRFGDESCGAHANRVAEFTASRRSD